MIAMMLAKAVCGCLTVPGYETKAKDRPLCGVPKPAMRSWPNHFRLHPREVAHKPLAD